MSQHRHTANGTNGHVPSGNGANTSTTTPTGQVNAEINGALTNDSDVGHLETDFLVVGCGPAGASLACFLGSHGAYKVSFLLYAWVPLLVTNWPGV